MYKRNYLPEIIMKISRRFVKNYFISLTKINAIFISLCIFLYNIP